MRTAADILDELMQGEPELTDGQYHHAKLAMQQYAKEALEEAMKSVDNSTSWSEHQKNILQLIDTLK